MNFLLGVAEHGTLIFDLAGLLGLCMAALAATRVARRGGSWGGPMMAWGAAALLTGRLFALVAPQFLTREVLAQLGHGFIAATALVPVVLLTGGLAGIVWGLWGHERWLRER